VNNHSFLHTHKNMWPIFWAILVVQRKHCTTYLYNCYAIALGNFASGPLQMSSRCGRGGNSTTKLQ